MTDDQNPYLVELLRVVGQIQSCVQPGIPPVSSFSRCLLVQYVRAIKRTCRQPSLTYCVLSPTSDAHWHVHASQARATSNWQQDCFSVSASGSPCPCWLSGSTRIWITMFCPSQSLESASLAQHELVKINMYYIRYNMKRTCTGHKSLLAYRISALRAA